MAKSKGRTSTISVGDEVVFVGEKGFRPVYDLTVGKKYTVRDIGQAIPGIKQMTINFQDNHGNPGHLAASYFKPVKG